MQITGIIKQAMPQTSGTSKRTGNPWVAQQFVIEEQNVQYPQSLLFQVFGQDKLQQFALREGDVVTVSFSMRVREYNGKLYNDTPLAYSVQRVQPQQGFAPMPQQQVAPQPQPQQQRFAPQQQQGYAPQPQQQSYTPQYGNTNPNAAPF